jgi:membrane protease YdiL (CAAX protease family)
MNETGLPKKVTTPDRKIRALIEVLAVYTLLIIVWKTTENSSLVAFDKKLFGWDSGLKILFLILIPMGIIKSVGRSPGKYGLTFRPFPDQIKISLLALAVLSPFYCIFPILMKLGVPLTSRTAAPFLSLTFLTGLIVLGILFKKQPSRAEKPAGTVEIIIFLALIALFLTATAATLSRGTQLPKITYMLFAVGFGEEIFFRGYIQSRLNEGFGRPFCTWNTQWGWGLIITALLFGIIHAFNPIGTPWWSVWTFFAGLLFGFLREKTGSILAPATVHGLPLAIGFLFS